MREDTDRVSLGGTLRSGVGLLGAARWPRVVGVAVLVALAATTLAGFLSRGRSDADLPGDLGGLWFGIVVTIVLAAGIDERLPPTSRTLARWLSLMACAYALAALAVVVSAALG